MTRLHYPEAGATVAVRDGLFGRLRTKALRFGRFRWGGKLGTLALVAPYPLGSKQGKVRGGDRVLTQGYLVLLFEGRIDNLNVQILSVFPEGEAEQVANSLLALPL